MQRYLVFTKEELEKMENGDQVLLKIDDKIFTCISEEQYRKKIYTRKRKENNK